MHGASEIDGTAAALRRLEANRLGRTARRFVEAMTQAFDDPQYFDRALRAEIDFEHDLAFEFQRPRFVGVGRGRLGDDFDRNIDSRRTRRLRRWRPWRRSDVEP